MSKAAEPRLSSLQQQRSRDTRRKLVDAAERLWRTTGFDETSVSEVCDAAGVSKGTFYFYFVRKEDLLVEVALGGVEALVEDWEAIAGDRGLTTEHALRRLIEWIADRNGRTPKPLLARTIVEVLGHAAEWPRVRGDRPDYPQTFAALFERGQARGEIDPRLHPQELGGMLSLVVLQAMLVWALTDGASLERILWRRASVILRGASA